jgi:uncharacterized protein YktB (UPF0637 family)
MGIISGNDKQTLCNMIIQLEAALDSTLQQIFERAGDRIKPEDQAKIQQEMANTKQLLERLRTCYESEMNYTAIPIQKRLEPVSNPQSIANTAPILL